LFTFSLCDGDTDIDSLQHVHRCEVTKVFRKEFGVIRDSLLKRVPALNANFEKTARQSGRLSCPMPTSVRDRDSYE
jgi:hypothetical protein